MTGRISSSRNAQGVSKVMVLSELKWLKFQVS